MRYSTVPAINFEAHVARNRELIKRLPQAYPATKVWDPATLSYVFNPELAYA